MSYHLEDLLAEIQVHVLDLGKSLVDVGKELGYPANENYMVLEADLIDGHDRIESPEAAKAWLKGRDYLKSWLQGVLEEDAEPMDGKSTLWEYEVEIVAVDSDGELIEDAVTRVLIAHPPPPPCEVVGDPDEDEREQWTVWSIDEEEHEWSDPYKWVGGAKECPGVWGGGGTSMEYKRICRRCGLLRDQYIAGSEQVPDEPEEKITYSEEAQEAFVAEYGQDEDEEW